MDSLQSVDTAAQRAARLAAWRRLPQLLVSRQWRWLTLGAILLALGLARLGVWQLDRLQQRRANNALIASRITAPPLKLTGQPIDVAANEYRSVVVSGVYDPSQEIVLRNRSRNGSPGSDVLTPLRIAGTNQAVLVDRGWVPVLLPDEQQLKQYVKTGPATIEGIIRTPQTRPSSLAPQDQRPANGRLFAWFRPDVAKIAQQIPYQIYPFYIEQKPVADPQALPSPALSVDYQSEGSHLSYAIQWFSFAIIGLCGYAGFVVTRTEQAAKQRAS